MNQNKVSYNFGKKGWGIIGYEVILLFFMTGMTVDGLNIIVPNMAAFKGWDADLLLSISTPAQIIALFLVVFWGGLIKKFGLKRVTVITMFLAAASTILYGNSMSVAMYAVMLVLMVVFINAFALNCGFAICANWFPTQKGIVMGFVTIGMNLASAIINLILNALTQRLNIAWAISIMGIVIGCIMLSGSLADAYAAAQGTVEVTTLHIFGLGVDLVGFQGGIIVALLMGLVTAKLDIFFERKVPEVIRLLVSPLLTTLVSSFLLFLLIGPIGRGLASGITNVLVWMTRNLGIFGYAAFSGVQQLIVITGLHHVFGAIESQLLVDTGRNFLNPLMSVAIIAQGGAVLGYMVRNMKDAKAKELCIPSFVSVLFGITEPALFGVNIRYRYPLAGGCIGGAVGGAIVYITNLAALGFGTTVVPGIALADPAHHGYMNYVIAHVVALGTGFLMIISYWIVKKSSSKNIIEDMNYIE